MIKTFANKDLKELFETGKSRRIDNRHHDRCRELLAALHSATDLRQVNLPGYFYHPLHQFKPLRYSLRVRGAWRITFEFSNGDAYRVDYEEYHGKI